MRTSFEIERGTAQALGVIFKHADGSIASFAEQPSHTLRAVAVINVERFTALARSVGQADRAPIVLVRQPLSVVVGGQPVLSQLAAAVNMRIPFGVRA